uniref:Uncharacterized protein n=1 Tax=Anguilla anguilla TaxID=7936 RepID=A0A0E9UW82_ANGAN
MNGVESCVTKRKIQQQASHFPMALCVQQFSLGLANREPSVVLT